MILVYITITKSIFLEIKNINRGNHTKPNCILNLIIFIFRSLKKKIVVPYSGKVGVFLTPTRIYKGGPS